MNLMDSKYIPIPFTILLLVFFCSVVASRVQRYETFFPGCVVGFGGIFEWGAQITILILAAINVQVGNVQTLPILFGFLILYGLNAANYYLFSKKIMIDPEYINWLKINHTHQITHKVIEVFGCLFHFKISRILFCRYFGFDFFKAKLTEISVLVGWNVVMGVSIAFN